MDLALYHLHKSPFRSTPDPECLVLSSSHKTALGALIQGIAERQGYLVLTGEVGLGKTTILRTFVDRVDPAQLQVIALGDAHVTFGDVLTTLCRALHLEIIPQEDVPNTLKRLHRLLSKAYTKGQNVALIVDDAQHMPVETLASLHLLADLTTSTETLLQIVLVGEPAFDVTLDTQALRPLQQRLGIRQRLAPLTTEESRHYILHRLAQARTTDEPIFTRLALRAIVNEAKGVPRTLNDLCTQALMQGGVYRKRRISVPIVREVIAAYRGQPPRQRWRFRVACLGAIMVLIVLTWWSPVLWTTEVWRSWSSYLPSWIVASAPQPTPGGKDVPPGGLAVGPPRGTPDPTPGGQTTPGPGAVLAGLRTIDKGIPLAQVALEVYSFSSNAVVAWIKHHNPQIRDLESLEERTQLHLPPLPMPRQ